MPSVMLSVDPGVNAMGLALWSWSPKKRGKLEPPRVAWVEELPARVLRLEQDWHAKMLILLAMLRKRLVVELHLQRLAHVFVEWPQVRGGAVGHAAAVRGDVSALAYCCGAVCQMAHDFEQFSTAVVELLPVSEWKGQLPKAATNKRIARAIGTVDKQGNPFDSHSWDAVGVGLVGKGYKLDDPAHFGRKP